MHRCVTSGVAALIAAVPFALAAQQYLPRNFPPDALRGEIVVQQPPVATLNGAPARLAPGARIRGGDNLLLLSGRVVGMPLLVHYTIDGHGLIKDVWVLRPEEAAKPWPRSTDEATRMVFDALAQTWSLRP